MNEITAPGDTLSFDDQSTPNLGESPVLDRSGADDGNQYQDILEFCVTDNLRELEIEWRELEGRANISIYQRFDWIDACINTLEDKLNIKAQIITGRTAGELVFIMPLVIENNFMPKFRWIGGNHSNYNLILIDSSFQKNLSIEDAETLFEQALNVLPDTGYLKLCCQPVSWKNKLNPLLAVAHQRSTNVALGMDLSGGFKNVLAAVNGKRKRKKYRSQTRAVEGVGGARLVEAANEAEALEILNCFYKQKSERFRDQGLKDVFGGLDTRQFLEQIAINSLGSNQPLLKLFALAIDGKYRAICGGGVSGKHFSAYFTSFSNDELAHISPGEMLLYMMVENLCDHGFESLDLGCGEERYKRSWCNITLEMFDIIHPLSPFSQPHVFAQRRILAAKRNIRENRYLWNYFKRARVVGTRLLDMIYR